MKLPASAMAKNVRARLICTAKSPFSVTIGFFDIKYGKKLIAKCHVSHQIFLCEHKFVLLGGYPEMKKKGETKPKAAPKPADKPAEKAGAGAKKGGKK
jgi:hypothetical protein